MRKVIEADEVLIPLKVEVARKANVSVDVVERLFEKFSVAEEVGTRHAEHLTVKRLMFKGEKRAAEMQNGPFTFEWSDLDTGLWLILSKGVNQIGKSSIIEVMIWALRGKIRQLRPEVRSWIDAVELDFSIGVDSYQVKFQDIGNSPVGKLLRVSPAPTHVLSTFDGEEEFEQTMNTLMMRRFTLHDIPQVNRKAEVAELVHHKWTLYAGSMFIEGSHDAILGDIAIGGLWWRMLNLFIGMPYAGEHIAIKSAKSLLDLRHEQGTGGRERHSSHQGELLVLRGRIEELKAQVSAASAPMPRSGDARELVTAYSRKALACTTLEKEAEELKHRVAVAESHVNESRAAVRRLEEGAAAKRFFSGLNPVCCPRCAQPFSDKRLDLEQESGNCAVCDRSGSSDDEEALAAAIEDAKEQIVAAKQAKGEIAAREAQVRAELDAASVELAKLAEDFQALESMAADVEALQRKRFELEHARGAYELLLRLDYDAGPTKADADLDEQRRILGIAEKIAEKRAKDGGGTLLGQFESKLVEVATRVGFRGLQRVSIRGNAIRLRVSNVDSTFTDQTPGQRLRLRISLVIAMMELARSSRRGNHPGLLFMDSPGGEELSPDDLNVMMGEIHSLCGENQNLQIFVSSARGGDFENAVSADRQRWGTATEPMF